MNTLLLLDDEENNLDSLERIFFRDYEVIKFTKAKEALNYIKENSVPVIISDQRMPQITGTQFFKECQKYSPNSIRLLLTGYTDLDSVIAAINEGHVYRYISKPWENSDLKQIVQQAFEFFMLRENLKIKNQELEKANLELKELDTSKSNFIYLINHELKTPLTSISSYLQMLQETSLDSEQNIFIQGIYQGYNRLEQLINDTLLIMAAQTGKLKLNLQKANLKDLYINARAKIESFKNEKKITISEDILNTKCKVDSRLIERVIENLLHNAIKYSQSSDCIKVVISDRQIRITNSAQGVTPEKIENYLKAFYIDEDYKNHSNSTGLGLSICQAILHLHKQKILFTTAKNQISFGFSINGI